MILVIGGTGTTGRALLRQLADLNLPARALVRARSGPRPGRPSLDRDLPRGVQVVTGDASHPGDVRAAMAGVEQVFLALSNGPHQHATELAVVRAARGAGVEHLVKVSAPVVGPDVPVAVARTHHAIEQAVVASGMRWTFLRPYAFLQNLLNHAPVIRATGAFFGTAGDARLNMVDARDIAAAAVVALTDPRVRCRAHVLTGPEAVSYAEVAARLSARGRPVRYVDLPAAVLRADLRRRDMPEWLVDHVVEIQQLAASHPETPNDTVARLTGHAPRSLDAFLAEHASAFAAPPAAISTLIGVSIRVRHRIAARRQVAPVEDSGRGEPDGNRHAPDPRSAAVAPGRTRWHD